MAGANSYNIGSDTTLTIVSNGQVLAATILTEFTGKQMTTRLTSKAITGVNRYRDVEEGWEGTLTFDRADSTMDAFFAAKESARYAGLPQPVITITETTANALDGSISKFMYDGVSLKLDDIGARKGDAKVDQKIGWVASRRYQVQ